MWSLGFGVFFFLFQEKQAEVMKGSKGLLPNAQASADWM